MMTSPIYSHVFRIGDSPVSGNISTGFWFIQRADNKRQTALSALKEGDGAFVRDKGQDDKNWRYAIVVAVERTASPPNLTFQVTTNGNIRKIEQYEWGNCVRPLCKSCNRAGHPKGADIAHAAPFHTTSTEDEGEQIALHSITAQPVYGYLSFEELRLRDYLDNCYGTKTREVSLRDRPEYKNWGGSDLNLFFEVDLGSKRVVLRRPLAGGTGVYTKEQCLHIVKNTTIKSSKERGRLIRFLTNNNAVPNQRALYRILQQDEKGLVIHDDNWALQCATRQSDIQLSDFIVWDSDHHDHAHPLPPLSKKRKLIGDEIMAKKEYIRWGLMNEKGWKGRIRLCVFPISFVESQQGKMQLQYSSAPLLDICSYIGESDIWRGGEFASEHYRQGGNHRICKLYFDPKSFPPPQKSTEVDNCPIFDHLKRYIRWAAWRDESPVVCKGGSSKDSKIFTCNKKYRNRHGKEKRCPFYFQVCWDNHGYYVHLLNDKAQRYDHNCGQGWHCCRQC